MPASHTFQPGPLAPQIEPVVDIAFAEADDIGAVLFLPGETGTGGDRAIVQLRADAVDAWAAAAHWWPEVLGVLTALIAMLALWRMFRVVQRPQRRGEPHCRRCNYNLSGHADRLAAPGEPERAAADGGGAEAADPSARAPGDEVRCPECGVDLAERQPRRGRAAWRRLAPAAAVLALVAGGYGALHVAGAGSRRTLMSSWFSVPSLWAEEQRQSRQWSWMNDYHARHDLLLEIDVATGKVVRRVALRRGSTYFRPAISPDGSLMALTGGIGSIDLVRTADGGREARFVYGNDPLSEPHRTVAFDPSGESLYVAFVEDGRDKLVRWNWGADKREELTSFPAYVRSRPGGGPSMPAVRRYALLHRPEGLRILAAPSFSEAYGEKLYDLRIFDESGAELARHEIAGAGPIGGPVVTPDGRRVFLQGGPMDIVGFDLEAGEALGRLSAGRLALGHEHAMSSDGRLLAVAAHGGIILVRDIEQKRWVAELRHDSNLIAPDLWFSPDGRWLAANPFASNSGAAGGGYIHHLLVFDLGEIGAEAGNDGE